MKRITLTLCLTFLTLLAAQGQRTLVLNAQHEGPKIAKTMYGVFFEDINFSADGGLYAELIENRSFEYPYHLTGWNPMGNVEIGDKEPAFSRNPHYARLLPCSHPQKITALTNHGVFGIGLHNGAFYDFSLYARALKDTARLTITLLDSANNELSKKNITVVGRQWEQYTLSFKAFSDVQRGALRITLASRQGADIDHVSLFPANNWHGLRPDLVQCLADLKPGVLRFPGGCIVEGTTLSTRYQWKNSIGPAENRPLNVTRWSDCMRNRIFPNYYQSLGLGFYEFFLLAEHIGAEPLPVVSCGIACQYQNSDDDPTAHVSIDSLKPYIDDALDLIAFANADTTNPWGRIRAEMGHPEPFNMKYIGIGNEQWGKLYPERLAPFVAAIRKQYPQIQIVGSSGPYPEGDRFQYGWKEMRKLGVDLVDEHYYRGPDWFLNNATRYDSYTRKGPKVFAGEYAVRGGQNSNNFFAALSEAAFMTGLERNADVVRMASYAPLFAHTDGWQWKPDLIWFDNMRSLRTANYYVQQLFSRYKGTNMMSITENGMPIAGNLGLYASAVADEEKGEYYVKLVNATDAMQDLKVVVKGLERGKVGMTDLYGDENDENTMQCPTAVVPKTLPETDMSGGVLKLSMPPMTFRIVTIKPAKR